MSSIKTCLVWIVPPVTYRWLNGKKAWLSDVEFRSDGAMQFHLARRNNRAGFNTGHVVNPLYQGHIAFRTDDLDAFKQQLEENNVPYSDYGHAAVQGWHQIFFYDPDGNVVEVHQIVDMEEDG